MDLSGVALACRQRAQRRRKAWRWLYACRITVAARMFFLPAPSVRKQHARITTHLCAPHHCAHLHLHVLHTAAPAHALPAWASTEQASRNGGGQLVFVALQHALLAAAASAPLS